MKRSILAIVLSLIFTVGTVNAGASSFIFSGFGRGGNIDGDRIDKINGNITKALAFEGFFGIATAAMLEARTIATGTIPLAWRLQELQ